MHPTRVYYVLSAMLGFGMCLTATVYGPLLLEIGLSLADIGLLNAAFFFMIVLAEMPTGMLADGKSRAWSIRLGLAFCAISWLSYAFATGFWTALFAELLSGVAMAFLSGAQQAWLADALIKRDEATSLGRAFGTAAFFKMFGALTGGLVGSFIGMKSLRLPFLAAALVFVCALVFVWFTLGNLGEPKQRVSEWEALRQSCAALRRSRSLGWVVAATMCIGLILPFNHYWTPYFRFTIGAANTGLLWIPMYISLASAGLLMRRFPIRPGREAVWIVAALMFAGLGLAGIGSTSIIPISIAFTLIHEVGRGGGRAVHATPCREPISGDVRIPPILSRTFRLLGDPASRLVPDAWAADHGRIYRHDLDLLRPTSGSIGLIPLAHASQADAACRTLKKDPTELVGSLILFDYNFFFCRINLHFISFFDFAFDNA